MLHKCSNPSSVFTSGRYEEILKLPYFTKLLSIVEKRILNDMNTEIICIASITLIPLQVQQITCPPCDHTIAIAAVSALNATSGRVVLRRYLCCFRQVYV